MVSIKTMSLVAQAAKKLSAIGTLISVLLISGVAQAEYRLNFQDPVTQVARDIFDLHMLIFWICVGIFVVVFSFMFYSIFAHRKSKDYQASDFSHSTKVEIVWTIIPFFILVAMAIPATKVLIDMEDTTKSELTIKITGYQWKWGYEYLDTDISFYSTLSTPRAEIDQFDKENAVEQNEHYLLQVDKHLIVPSGRKVRALITSNDVIHAWWIPAFGAKKDAVPGYINELWFNVDVGKEGLYRGQCAELCGKDHAFMPIVVEVVSAEKFDNWIASGGNSYTAEAGGTEQVAEAVVEAVTAQADAFDSSGDTITQVRAEEVVTAPATITAKTWTKDELMTKGKEVASNCVACHGAEGKGLPPTFPPIAGSAIATGPIAKHIDTVMFGVGGSAMMAFANQLSDQEIASVITYQRNAYGNNTGDVVLPADIKAKRN